MMWLMDCIPVAPVIAGCSPLQPPRTISDATVTATTTDELRSFLNDILGVLILSRFRHPRLQFREFHPHDRHRFVRSREPPPKANFLSRQPDPPLSRVWIFPHRQVGPPPF